MILQISGIGQSYWLSVIIGIENSRDRFACVWSRSWLGLNPLTPLPVLVLTRIRFSSVLVLNRFALGGLEHNTTHQWNVEQTAQYYINKA
jgi:hypothetical protein